MQPLVAAMMFLSVLFPQKTWYAPNQPINVTIKAPADVALFMTNFTGNALEAKADVIVPAGEKTLDVKTLFPSMSTPGTYLLYAVPRNKPNREFIGTPLVIEVRQDKRQGAPPDAMAVKISPMCYAILSTDKGPPMTITLYYDVAPNTVASFLALAQGGFYDGLTFHRIIKDFVIQGGDPRGDGTGGPGFTVGAEFNDRQHLEGVLSMARAGDPNEAGGAMPRCEFANSAGSQFFICLNYTNTKQLDRRYTAFGKVISGMEAVNAIAATPVVDEVTGRPKDPPHIVKIEVRPVTAKENPYPRLLEQIQPSLIPAAGTENLSPTTQTTPPTTQTTPPTTQITPPTTQISAPASAPSEKP